MIFKTCVTKWVTLSFVETGEICLGLSRCDGRCLHLLCSVMLIINIYGNSGWRLLYCQINCNCVELTCYLVAFYVFFNCYLQKDFCAWRPKTLIKWRIESVCWQILVAVLVIICNLYAIIQWVTVIYKKKIANLLSSVENLLFPTYTEIHVKWKFILTIYMQSPAKDSFIDLKLIFLYN